MYSSQLSNNDVSTYISDISESDASVPDSNNTLQDASPQDLSCDVLQDASYDVTDAVTDDKILSSIRLDYFDDNACMELPE